MSESGGASSQDSVSLSATLEALLFLSPVPVATADLAAACEVDESDVVTALGQLDERLSRGVAGTVLRQVADGYALASIPEASKAVHRLFAKPRFPALTQAQLECLAIAAYTGPVSRPEIAQIRGVASDSAMGILVDRGLLTEDGRSEYGAVLYRTTKLFEQLFGLSGLDALPAIEGFEPTDGEKDDLRASLLDAGSARDE